MAGYNFRCARCEIFFCVGGSSPRGKAIYISGGYGLERELAIPAECKISYEWGLEALAELLFEPLPESAHCECEKSRGPLYLVNPELMAEFDANAQNNLANDACNVALIEFPKLPALPSKDYTCTEGEHPPYMLRTSTCSACSVQLCKRRIDMQTGEWKIVASDQNEFSFTSKEGAPDFLTKRDKIISEAKAHCACTLETTTSRTAEGQ